MMLPFHNIFPLVIIVLLLISCPWEGEAFIGHHISTRHQQHTRPISHVSVIPRREKEATSRLFNSGDDDEESDSEKKQTAMTTKKTDDIDNNKSNNVGQKVGFGVLSAFGYFIQVMSWLISAGLVLNIFGYGYQINRDEGTIEIDTLQRIRTKNQFEAEYERMGRNLDLSRQQKNLPQ